MISTMRFVLHSSAGYESVCDGVGVTGRHADRSRELRMQRWQPSFGPLEFPRGICWNRGDRLESTPSNGSRMSRSPSDAPVPLERRNGPSASGRSSSPYVVNFLCCRAVMLEQVYVELNPLGRRNYPPCWRQGPTHPLIRGGMG